MSPVPGKLDPRLALRVGMYLLAGLLLALGVRALTASDPAPICDAACVALGQATKHAREAETRARSASQKAETRYVTRRSVVREVVKEVEQAQSPRDSIDALLHVVAVQEEALAAADSMLARFRVERVATDSLHRSLDRENAMLRAQVRALQPSSVALFVRRTLPVVAFAGGLWAGSQVTR